MKSMPCRNCLWSSNGMTSIVKSDSVICGHIVSLGDCQTNVVVSKLLLILLFSFLGNIMLNYHQFPK